MELRAFLVVAGSLWWLGGVTALAQPNGVTGYEAVSIGVPQGHRSSDAFAIDEYGRIAGDAREFSGRANGVAWTNGSLIILPPPLGAERAHANGMSPSSGIVVGGAEVNGELHAVAWSITHGVHLLDNPGGPSMGCVGGSVNDSGFVAGSCVFPNLSVLWPRLDPPIDLGNLGTGGGLEGALDINELGEIVGTSRNTCGEERPYLWRNGEMIDIGGEPCYATGDALGINNFTEVVGNSFTRRTGWYWSDGQIVDLPAPFPCGNALRKAAAINDAGLIVGQASDAECGFFKATIWDRNQSFQPYIINHYLRNPDVDLIQPHDINSAGQVAAFGEYDDGRERGFLVTPYLFEMSDPSPGRAGALNTITITGLSPNQRVLLAYGTREGAQKIRAGCPGGTLLIRDPQASALVRADANGVASIIVNVPKSARGRTFRMQAIAPFECAISHTVTWTFE